MFINKAYDIPILPKKKENHICSYCYNKTNSDLLLNLRRFILSVRLLLACSYFFAEFEPHVLIKLFLYIKKRVSKNSNTKSILTNTGVIHVKLLIFG